MVERSATAGPVDGTPASGLDGTPGPAATASLDPVPTPAPEPPPPAPAGGRAALWSGQAEGPGFPWLAYRVTPGDNPDTDPWLFESGPLVSGPLDLKRFSCRPEPQEGGLRLSQCTGLPDGIDFAAFVEDGGDRRMTVTLIGQRRGGTLRRNASLTAVEERAEPPVTADVSLLWRHDETSSFGQHTDIWAADGIVFAPHDSGRIEVLDAATGAPLAVIDARAVQGGTPPGPLSVTDVKARDGLLYAATAGAGLLIFDVRAPSAPQLVGQYIVWVAPQSPENFVDVHNIFMSPGGEIVYAINQSHPQSDLRLIDVSDPASPREAGRFVIPTARTLLEGAHDVNVVEFDERLIAFLSALRSGLLILEVTDPAAIRMLGSIAWEGIFSHSGWPFRAGDRLYYAHAEEGFDRGMTVLDVTDLSAPRAVSRFVTRAGISVHNVEVVEGFAYLSYYIDGLRVLDLRDPANPRELGRFDTVPANEERGIAQGAWGVHVTDGVVFISDVEEGIYALKVGTLGAATDSNRHQPVRVLSPMSLVRRPNRQRKAACARRRGRGARRALLYCPSLTAPGRPDGRPGRSRCAEPGLRTTSSTCWPTGRRRTWCCWTSARSPPSPTIS